MRPISVALDPFDSSTLLVTTAGLGLRELTIAPDLEVSAGPLGAALTLAVRNKGPHAATNVRVTADLPASATGISATSPGATCAVAGVTVTCTYAALPPAVTPSTISIGATVATAGTLAASVQGDQPDPIAANNSASASVAASAAPPPPSSGGGGGGGGGVSLEWLALLAASAAAAHRRRGAA
jgi:hypothetical protein